MGRRDLIEKRKDAHLTLATTAEVEPAGSRTLFDEVTLVHDALPELALEEIDTRASLCGRPLAAPLLVTGMTGGTARAREINRDLAVAAERAGCAFGVGSQRAMAEDPERAESYQVRDVAPRVVLLANIGGVQAARMGKDRVARLMQDIGADGLCVHLNPAQELVQPEGDRDFRGVLAALEALAGRLGERLLVKETGAGISPRAAARLWAAGVRTVDVSGLGGTSWTRVEALRAEGPAREMGEAFARWGIPAAACVAAVTRAVPGMQVVASGGIRDGLDVARALALGAHCAGMALPLLRAREKGGLDAAAALLQTTLHTLRTAMALCGARDLAGLRARKPHLGPLLASWVAALLEDHAA